MCLSAKSYRFASKTTGIIEAMPNRFQLAAIDLDDTLLGEDKRIGGANIRAVHRLLEAGMHVVLASGRHHSNMTDFHAELGLSDPIVSCNGAQVKANRAGDVWHQQTLPQDLAHELILRGDEIGITQNYYHTDGGLYVRERNGWTDMYAARTGSEIFVAGELTDFDNGAPLKIVWVDEAHRITLLLSDMQARYGSRLNILTTDPEYLEFMAHGVNKANGLRVVAAHLQIAPENIIAFGDGNNDVDMLLWAGFGVAMDHGRASAKAASDAVSPPGDEESGLARAVDAFVF